MARDGYRSVTLNNNEYEELVALGVKIGEGLGLRPLSVPEVIRYLKRDYQKTHPRHAIIKG